MFNPDEFTLQEAQKRAMQPQTLGVAPTMGPVGQPQPGQPQQMGDDPAAERRRMMAYALSKPTAMGNVGASAGGSIMGGLGAGIEGAARAYAMQKATGQKPWTDGMNEMFGKWFQGNKDGMNQPPPPPVYPTQT